MKPSDNRVLYYRVAVLVSKYCTSHRVPKAAAADQASHIIDAAGVACGNKSVVSDAGEEGKIVNIRMLRQCSGDGDDDDIDSDRPVLSRDSDGVGGWSRVIASDVSTFSLHLNNKICSCAIVNPDHGSASPSSWRLRMRVPMLLGSSVQSRLRGQVKPALHTGPLSSELLTLSFVQFVG